MGFKNQLKERLKENLTEEELSLLPRGFQTIGDVMILKLKNDLLNRKELIADTCLKMFPKIRSVYINLGKISGKFRQPEDIRHLAGIENPITIHKEHGILYKFDFTKIMFSKGNLNERKYLSSLVKPNEIVVDMFAGIGYFSLPIAKYSKAKKIYSIELNPLSCQFLVENIKINKLEQKIIPLLGDCRERVLELSVKGVQADRIVMGIFPAPKEYIKNALSLVNREKGTIFHYEGVQDKGQHHQLYHEFEEIAKKNKYTTRLLSYRNVKSVSPNLFHYVLDIVVN